MNRVNVRRILVEWPPAGPMATLIVIFVLAWLLVPNFATMRTVSGIINAAPTVGIVTLGVTLLMITREFDLSVGAMLAAGSYLYAFNTMPGMSPIGGLLLALIIPGMLGAINGILVVTTRLPSFIITLGTLSIYRGVVWVISGGLLVQTLERPQIFEIINGRFDLLNNLIDQANFRTATLWLILLAIALELLLTRTSFGNRLFAIGGNPGAAAAQGINVKLTKIMTFTIVGVLAGFAGAVDFSQFRSVRVATGAGIELDAIAAAVVGATLLSGGSGRVFGAIVGVLLVSTLRTAVILMGMPSDNFEGIVGVGIIIAVILNTNIQKRF